MGDDTLAVLTPASRVFDYFRQQFAQIRRLSTRCVKRVMSLSPPASGREMNVFCEAEGQAHRLSF